MKTLDDALNALLESFSYGTEAERNRKVAHDWFIWTFLEKKRTFRSLGEIQGGISHERARQILNAQKRGMRHHRRRKHQSEILDAFDAILKAVKDCNDFVEHDRFAQKLVEVGLCSSPILIEGIIELADVLGIQSRLPLKLLTVNNLSYVIHEASLKALGEKNIQDIEHTARRLARKIGGIYPYQLFFKEEICQVIPEISRANFIRTLLENQTDYLSFGQGRFFAFKESHSSFDTYLQKIFSVYDEVPVENLIKVITSPMETRLKGKGEHQYLLPLEQCQEVLDDFCLAMGFYSKSNSSNRISEKSLSPSEGVLFSKELDLVLALRRHGCPMPTKQFMPLVSDKNILSLATLFYKTGLRGSYIYHTLDNQYDGQVRENSILSDLETYAKEEGTFVEGGKAQRLTNYYERNPELRTKALQYHGTVCEICGFDFEEVYGEHGAGFIEIHHIIPVSTLEDKTIVDPRKDMIAVCANCHRMFHRKKELLLSPNDLREKLTVMAFVVCIKASESITPGKVYQVLQEEEESDDVLIVNDDGKECLHDIDCFVSFDLPESKGKALIDAIVE